MSNKKTLQVSLLLVAILVLGCVSIVKATEQPDSPLLHSNQQKISRTTTAQNVENMRKDNLNSIQKKTVDVKNQEMSLLEEKMRKNFPKMSHDERIYQIKAEEQKLQQWLDVHDIPRVYIDFFNPVMGE